jgi:hypothetical protein
MVCPVDYHLECCIVARFSKTSITGTCEANSFNAHKIGNQLTSLTSNHPTKTEDFKQYFPSLLILPNDFKRDLFYLEY